jgi:RHS repeat-associated protein
VFFTGKPYDADLGAYLFKHRSYDPALCRWTTPDPSGFPDGANNWVYVNNGATSHFDSLGLAVTEIHGVEDISCRAYHTGSPEWILVDMSVRESIPAGGAAAVYGISVQWERRATTQYTPTGYTTKSATGGILGASSEITKGEGYYYIYPINYSFPSGFCLASSISNTIYQNIGELLGLAGDYGWGEVEGTAMVSMVKAAMTGGEEDVQLTLNDIMNSGPRDAASSYFWKDIKFVE